MIYNSRNKIKWQSIKIKQLITFITTLNLRSNNTQIKSPAGSSSGVDSDSRNLKDKDNATVRIKHHVNCMLQL